MSDIYSLKKKNSKDLFCEYCIGTVENQHDYMRTADHTSMRLIHCREHPMAANRCSICSISVYEEMMMVGCDVCIAVREAMYALADVRGDEELNFDAPNSDYGGGCSSNDGDAKDCTYDADGETTDFEESEVEDIQNVGEILESPQSPVMVETAQLLLMLDSGREEEIASEIHFSQY